MPVRAQAAVVSARPNLRVIDADGELVADRCAGCMALEEELGRKVKQIRELKRDREAEAKVHPQRAAIVEVFDHWRESCRHPNSKLDADRADLIAGKLKVYGLETCKRAVDGAAFDPFVTQRKNGKPQRHDGIKLVFGTAEKFESFVNRAPPPEPELPIQPQLPV